MAIMLILKEQIDNDYLRHQPCTVHSFSPLPALNVSKIAIIDNTEIFKSSRFLIELRLPVIKFNFTN